MDSVEKTGRLIVVDETCLGALAADAAALAASEVFSSLSSIKTVTGPHSPVPFAKELETAFFLHQLRLKQ